MCRLSGPKGLGLQCMSVSPQVAGRIDEERGDAAAAVLVGLNVPVGVVGETGQPRRRVDDALEEGAGGVVRHGPEPAGAVLHGLNQGDLIGSRRRIVEGEAVGLRLDPAATRRGDEAVIGARGRGVAGRAGIGASVGKDVADAVGDSSRHSPWRRGRYWRPRAGCSGSCWNWGECRQGRCRRCR
jgi:hypothetical protein